MANRQKIASLHGPEADELAAFLKEVRREVGIGQERLSRLLGQSQNYVRKIELGERRIDVIEFTKFVQAIGLDPASVYDRFVKRLAG